MWTGISGIGTLDSVHQPLSPPFLGTPRTPVHVTGMARTARWHPLQALMHPTVINGITGSITNGYGINGYITNGYGINGFMGFIGVINDV